jgi:hypothetical protein
VTLDINSARAVLADPAWTQAVIVAAINAANTLTDIGPDGLTPDGDDPAMTARSILNTALIDDAALRSAER